MTQPVQEPTQGRTDSAQEFRTRQLFRRPAIVNPGGSGGGYLQARGAKYAGFDFQVLTQNNGYNGGNGAGWRDGTWEYVEDAGCPFEGVSLLTLVDGDWFPFPLGNLGPQGTGYGVSFFYEGDPTNNGIVDIEFATVSVDELANTSGPNGSDTSVLSCSDFEFWDATPPGWYNNDNLTPDHGYRFDLSDASAGWTQALINVSTFHLNSPDGTPLTADSTAFGPTWDESSEFEAGGGPDLWWYMRIRVNGTNSSGTKCNLGKVWVHRLNGVLDFVG